MTQMNASTRIMYEEAQKMGITCTPLGDKETIIMEKSGKKWLTRGSRTSIQSSVGKTIADNKSLTKRMLNHYKLPTATYADVRSAADFNNLDALSFPLVMKPIEGTHGKGVIVGIKTREEAETLFTQQESPVIFEELLSGIEYRIVCVDFHFVAAAFRKPAFVTGDDTHTIQELVDIKNQHPWRGTGHEANLTLIEIDDLVIDFLAVQGFTPSSVVPKDVEVKLRKTANLSTGGEAWDVTDSVCQENKLLFEEIAKACDLNIIGIDIMCTDLSKPLIEQPAAGVIEVNSSPGLRMHHYPIQGQARNIAKIILESVYQNYAPIV